MGTKKRSVLIGVALLVVSCADVAFSSQDTNGTNGIKSLGLGLSGENVSIGQVEPGRPGKSTSPPSDDPAYTNSMISPTAVYLLNGAATKNANILTDNAHAERVAGLMISTDSVRTGVAPKAMLYSERVLKLPE